jgi:hypothetical protein
MQATVNAPRQDRLDSARIDPNAACNQGERTARGAVL